MGSRGPPERLGGDTLARDTAVVRERSTRVPAGATPLAGRPWRDVRSDLGLGAVPLAVGLGPHVEHLELIVLALAEIDGWHVVVVGAPRAPEALVHPAQVAAERAGVRPRTHLLPGVPASELPTYLSTADVGLHVASSAPDRNGDPPAAVLALLAAGLPVAAPEDPDLGYFLSLHGVGTTFDPSSPADIVAGLTRASALRGADEAVL